MQARYAQRIGMKALAAFLPEISQAALAKRGLATAQILANWHMIAGAMLAAASRPLHLAPAHGDHGVGILTIKVRPGMVPEFQHWQPLIIERINAHFGYRAVDHLKLVHGALVQDAGVRRPMACDPAPVCDTASEETADEAALNARLDQITDPGLRMALLRLGRHIRT